MTAQTPGALARRGYRRGQADTLEEAAGMLDEFGAGLRDAIERLGVREIERNLRLAAGLTRAQAQQLRAESAQRAERAQELQTTREG